MGKRKNKFFGKRSKKIDDLLNQKRSYLITRKIIIVMAITILAFYSYFIASNEKFLDYFNSQTMSLILLILTGFNYLLDNIQKDIKNKLKKRNRKKRCQKKNSKKKKSRNKRKNIQINRDKILNRILGIYLSITPLIFLYVSLIKELNSLMDINYIIQVFLSINTMITFVLFIYNTRWKEN